MSDEETPITRIIAESKEHLVHSHANDPNLRGPGFGEVKFEPIAEGPRSIGYEPYVSVEVFHYTPDPETIAREILAYLKGVFS